MSNPLISIIVPVYNVEKYLPKCLNSIVNQTYRNIEIICINDGSQDNSEEILRNYTLIDDRIKLLSTENKGASEARNKGLDVAKGNYIMFVDSDDWVNADTCYKALETAETYDADIVMWDYVREYEKKSAPKNIFNETIVFDEKEVKEKLHRRMIGIIGEELKHPENADALCTIWGKLYKRGCIYNSNIRFYDIRKIGTYEDGLFNLEVFDNVKKAVYIHEFLYHYRKNNINSITTKYNCDLLKQHERIHALMRKYIKDNGLDKSYGEALNNRIALGILGQGLNILGLKNNRITSIKEIISNGYYRKAYRELSLRYFPLHWKVFYGCAKYNFATGVYGLLLCIKRIIGQ